MSSYSVHQPHPRHAELVENLCEYIAATPRMTARGLGLRIAQDARLMPNLARGQEYPAKVMAALHGRLVAFYTEQLHIEQADLLEAA